MSKKQPREPHNIKFLPYSLWETVKWIGKHIIMDFYYPFIVVIFFLFVTPVVTALLITVSPYWFYTFLIIFCFVSSLLYILIVFGEWFSNKDLINFSPTDPVPPVIKMSLLFIASIIIKMIYSII